MAQRRFCMRPHAEKNWLGLQRSQTLLEVFRCEQSAANAGHASLAVARFHRRISVLVGCLRAQRYDRRKRVIAGPAWWAQNGAAGIGNRQKRRRCLYLV